MTAGIPSATSTSAAAGNPFLVPPTSPSLPALRHRATWQRRRTLSIRFVLDEKKPGHVSPPPPPDHKSDEQISAVRSAEKKSGHVSLSPPPDHESNGQISAVRSAEKKSGHVSPPPPPDYESDGQFSAVRSAEKKSGHVSPPPPTDYESDGQISAVRSAEKFARKKSERLAYLVAAVMSTLGTSSMAVFAVYYRFYWQMEGKEVPVAEMFATFALSVGAAVGMEFWAQWAHKALWHASLWHMHKSHHKPRDGAFELNDVFAIINAVPAIALLNYGFFHRGFFSGLCFGAGLGITVFGMAYMFVHDGLVHKRFAVGPIANVPYFRRVAAAHQLHHSEKFNGVPYGLFLGPKEVEEVGGLDELEKEIKRRIKSSKN